MNLLRGSFAQRGALSAASRALSAAAAVAERARISITPSCVDRLKKLSSSEGAKALRVAVDSGGCSGFSYSFKLEPLAAELGSKDRVFEQDGASIVVDALSLEYLNGATVDYVQEMVKSSFEVKDNPNSEASCGCGTSFSPK
jgi:iron-sulfur cluster assembly accessory protein